MAVCIAVIAKENYPLYIRSIPIENELKFHYTVHTSLDVVDEKISAMGKALVDQRELYLGLLYPTEDYKVHPVHYIRDACCRISSSSCTLNLTAKQVNLVCCGNASNRQVTRSISSPSAVSPAPSSIHPPPHKRKATEPLPQLMPPHPGQPSSPTTAPNY